ncbi:unnamed protein product [Adineta steineri]|uniref:Complex I assembly factor TIMMDC1, mitochondrial n=1 Tax=Adineta steineri TaxID=433720 RepID=A0A814Q9F2_9BILA|nr:unnamed protein product [Adineta steineri]CAF1117209.1 unnamed protein product [Adineta steineri]CAF1419430.1 unnamed protein product [Adineta steineri]CAF3760726.1 unnamed protein product [Adineta steineri]
MIYLFLSRSIAWPINIFGSNSNNKPVSILDDEYQRKKNLDESPPLISNKDLIAKTELSKNMDQTNSLIKTDRIPNLPSPNVLSLLGKHYLTREDLENLIQTRFKQETPRDRVERFLWKDELGKYPIYAQIKDWQCTAIAMGLGCLFGYNRKEEMKPVYIRQTSMLKFQDRLTAERAYRQFNVVMFMKEAYRIAIIVLFITETFMTSQYAIQAYRNKSTIYDCVPGGAFVGFALKMFHSPLAAFVSTIQGSIMGFMYGFVHNVGCRIINRTYEDLHYESVTNYILQRENAELWSAELEELPPAYIRPEPERTWGLGWFKS